MEVPGKETLRDPFGSDVLGLLSKADTTCRQLPAPASPPPAPTRPTSLLHGDGTGLTCPGSPRRLVLLQENVSNLILNPLPCPSTPGLLLGQTPGLYLWIAVPPCCANYMGRGESPPVEPATFAHLRRGCCSHQVELGYFPSWMEREEGAVDCVAECPGMGSMLGGPASRETSACQAQSLPGGAEAQP